MKKILFLFLLSMFTGVICAEDMITVTPAAATPGGEVFQMEINMENTTTTFIGLQMDITLPEGFSFYKSSSTGKASVVRNNNRLKNYSYFLDEEEEEEVTVTWTIGQSFQSDNCLRVTADNNMNDYIQGTSGVLIKVKIQADANAFPGVHRVKISNVHMSNMPAENEFIDVRLPDAVGELVIPTTDGNYYTYASSAAYTIPTGVAAYTAKLNADGTYVNITPVAGNMPAGEGILFQASEGFEFDFAAYTGIDLAQTDNELIGSSTAMVPDQTNYDYYIFGDDGTHGVGFYHYTGTTDIPANKAVLRLAKEASAPGLLRIVQVATDVESVEAVGNGQAYDILGRQVAHPDRGLYIINGKVIFK